MAAGRPPSRHSPTTACSRLQWIFVVRLLPDAILLQPPVERAAAHAELLCREADIAIVARQDLFDEHALRFLQRQMVGAAASAMRTARSIACASSRTLPGQPCPCIAARASASSPASGLR